MSYAATNIINDDMARNSSVAFKQHQYKSVFQALQSWGIDVPHHARLVFEDDDERSVFMKIFAAYLRALEERNTLIDWWQSRRPGVPLPAAIMKRIPHKLEVELRSMLLRCYVAGQDEADAGIMSVLTGQPPKEVVPDDQHIRV